MGIQFITGMFLSLLIICIIGYTYMEVVREENYKICDWCGSKQRRFKRCFEKHFVCKKCCKENNFKTEHDYLRYKKAREMAEKELNI